MVNYANGIGYFTAENIVAVLKAVPEIDGTYDKIVEHAREYDADVSQPRMVAAFDPE